MRQRVGTCSICGGDVMGHIGGWWATVPPPPDTCASCGAVAAYDCDVIKMVPCPRRYHPIVVSVETSWEYPGA
ncbi:MAG: hypothetical protein ACXABY_01400 [Candidatus Thorarchaeota archaeon]|jgi:hypothetical protein